MRAGTPQFAKEQLGEIKLHLVFLLGGVCGSSVLSLTSR